MFTAALETALLGTLEVGKDSLLLSLLLRHEVNPETHKLLSICLEHGQTPHPQTLPVHTTPLPRAIEKADTIFWGLPGGGGALSCSSKQFYPEKPVLRLLPANTKP